MITASKLRAWAASAAAVTATGRPRLVSCAPMASAISRVDPIREAYTTRTLVISGLPDRTGLPAISKPVPEHLAAPEANVLIRRDFGHRSGGQPTRRRGRAGGAPPDGVDQDR